MSKIFASINTSPGPHATQTPPIESVDLMTYFAADSDPSISIGYPILRYTNPKNNRVVYLAACGDVYNSRALSSALNIPLTSSLEILLHLYVAYGMEHALRVADGVFAFVLLDCAECVREHRTLVDDGARVLEHISLTCDPVLSATADESVEIDGVRVNVLETTGDMQRVEILGEDDGSRGKSRSSEHIRMFVARDPLGQQSLYSYVGRNIAFASDVKRLLPVRDQPHEPMNSVIHHFLPGTYWESELHMTGEEGGVQAMFMRRYHLMQTSQCCIREVPHSNMFLYTDAARRLHAAIDKCLANTISPLLQPSRSSSAEVAAANRAPPQDVACFLSGGLDSAILASMLANNPRYRLHTFTIGEEGAPRFLTARKIAAHIRSTHHEVVMTAEDAFRSIPEIIYRLETPDVRTIRNAIGMFCLAKEVRARCGATRVFLGDGADELFGGHLHMHACPDDFAFDNETRRMLTEMYQYDLVKTCKCLSLFELQACCPFLDPALIDFILGVPPDIRRRRMQPFAGSGYVTKSWLRSLVGDGYIAPTLPMEILWPLVSQIHDAAPVQRLVGTHAVSAQIVALWSSLARTETLQEGTLCRGTKWEASCVFLHHDLTADLVRNYAVILTTLEPIHQERLFYSNLFHHYFARKRDPLPDESSRSHVGVEVLTNQWIYR